MKLDDIIRFGEQADEAADRKIKMRGEYHPDWHQVRDEAFAALVAAYEREACCKIVYGQCESDNVAQRTVDAIRARGET